MIDLMFPVSIADGRSYLLRKYIIEDRLDTADANQRVNSLLEDEIINQVQYRLLDDIRKEIVSELLSKHSLTGEKRDRVEAGAKMRAAEMSSKQLWAIAKARGYFKERPVTYHPDEGQLKPRPNVKINLDSGDKWGPTWIG